MSKKKFNSESLRPFIDMAGLKGDEVVERKQYVSEIKVMPDEEMTVIAKISTTAVDADGDVVDPAGCILTRFLKNPVIHADHSYKIEDVIGKATEIAVTKDGITAKIQFANVTQRARDAWELVKAGYVKANSIGFIALSGVIRGTKEFDEYVKGVSYKVGADCNRIITGFELLESSIVSIPANPLALMQAISSKSINLSKETITALDLKIIPVIDTPVVSEPLNAPVKEVIPPVTAKKVCPMPGDEGDCDECYNEECPGYALYLASRNKTVNDIVEPADVVKAVEPVTVTPVATVEPVKPEPIVEPVKSEPVKPETHWTVLREGPLDIQAELELQRAKQLGRIV